MKTFNVQEDQLLNKLAVDYVNGDEEAGEQFFEIVMPKLQAYAFRFKANEGDSNQEERVADFYLVAVEKIYDFVEKYNDGTNNVLGLIYLACNRKKTDIGRNSNADCRSDRFVKSYTDENGKEVKTEETFSRTISLQTSVNEDGDSTVADKVSGNQKSIEDQVSDYEQSENLQQILLNYLKETKGRNANLMPILYVAKLQDWDTEQVDEKVAEILENEKGKVPTNATIRKAKSRAWESFKNFIEDGKIHV